jgi:hypothetical protein
LTRHAEEFFSQGSGGGLRISAVNNICPGSNRFQAGEGADLTFNFVGPHFSCFLFFADFPGRNSFIAFT